MIADENAPSILELVEQHYSLLYRYAFRLCGSVTDAEDLTQQTYLTACTHFDQLRDRSRAKSWLCAILRNIYLKAIRDERLCEFQSLDDVAENGFAPCFESTVDSEQLQRALAELPEQFRSVVILYYFQQFSYQELAEQMDVPVGTIMSRLSRAKAHLRNRLSLPDMFPVGRDVGARQAAARH